MNPPDPIDAILSRSVWDAIDIGDTLEEAENMKQRSALVSALKKHITRTGMSQAQAAKLGGVALIG